MDETDHPLSLGTSVLRPGAATSRVPNLVSLAPRFVGEFEKKGSITGGTFSVSRSCSKSTRPSRGLRARTKSASTAARTNSVSIRSSAACADRKPTSRRRGPVIWRRCGWLREWRRLCFLKLPPIVEAASDTDRASYHISTTSAEVGGSASVSGPPMNRCILDERAGRQLLHVTFGSVLTQGVDSRGRRFRDGLLEVLHGDAALHGEFRSAIS